MNLEYEFYMLLNDISSYNNLKELFRGYFEFKQQEGRELTKEELELQKLLHEQWEL